MSISTRLKWYLDSHRIKYELVSHQHTSTSLESARAANVPGGRVAKSILLEDERGYLMAVIPASCRLNMEEIEDQLGRHFELASEHELGDIFKGCEVGAVPPVGQPFNIPIAIDDSLLRLPDVYFEAGDHEGLVHITGGAFKELMSGALHGRISRPH
jgi:Ala-tRNA(Pro) deacylase